MAYLKRHQRIELNVDGGCFQMNSSVNTVKCPIHLRMMNMMFTHIYILQPAVALPIKDNVYLYPNMFRDYKNVIYNTLYK